MKCLALLLPTLIGLSTVASQAEDPAYWKFAPTPPMGWNSYDAFGASVTEDEVLANASYMKDHLLSHGWKYIVVDYRWADATAKDHSKDGVIGQPLTMDANGRLLPAPERFPSATGGAGFKPLADKIHAMGLLFGIHVMRGIPRLAVKANLPIEGSEFHAVDAANQKSKCAWCPDMFGVKGGSPAGQAYYDSIFRLYASWGLDFVKVDDLSNPYHADDIEAIRNAIDKCGRSIVFSTSPGETPIKDSAYVATHANMWRISGDFWDNWKSLDHAFEVAARWQGIGGPGHWPDLDMIPFGRIGIRSVGHDRQTKFTRDEQIALMSLWSLAPSPLMLGMSLPDNDDWTLGLLTNDEVLAVDQDPLGSPAHRVAQDQTKHTEVWIRDLQDGSKAVGLFNRGDADAIVSLAFKDAGLAGKQSVRDLWLHKDLGTFDNQIALPVPRHGGVLLRLRP